MATILPETDIILAPPVIPHIPLPKGWTDYTLLAILHVIALARIVILNASNWGDGKECDGLRLRVENDRLRSEVGLLQREIEIKDARFARLDSKKRPHYRSCERLEILMIRAARGLTNGQTAKRFQVTVQTIINWLRGIDKDEPTVQMPEKPTRYPDLVRYIVQQFKSYCPMLGRFKIADILCRAGLHLSASTIKRIIDEPPIPPPEPLSPPNPTPDKPTVQAWYPNHVWSVDLTVVPTTDGLWTPWSPNAMTQVHPYAWYVMVVIDHYSRRIMGFNVFEQCPTSLQIISSMNRICNDNAVKPKYIISDQGTQFVSAEFQSWCNDNKIKQRFGAVGKHGSIAVTERVILTYKDGCTRRILVPLSKNEMANETRLFFNWYNEYRPHMTLLGKTPNEVYFHRHPANAKPRIETRPLAKHKTPCASPRMCIAGRAGAKINVRLDFLEGRQHLPIIRVERI
ncbi:MAG: DDE-type integrase/transposase/recombinase [Planctomycetaceae bacterium]|jgi:transposase InsO family protein/DNA-binding transcriptional regulator YiaG|nr:DDE-type integrase/transposase/recombinase [Planctomycetaceae bacterium]